MIFLSPGVETNITILSGLIHDSTLTSVFRENVENPGEGFQGNKPIYNVCSVYVWLSPFLQAFHYCQRVLA